MSVFANRRLDEAARAWHGPYREYDIVKEAAIALGVVTALCVVLAILFSSPDERPSTIAGWSRQRPLNFLTTATAELDGTSATARYGPPYNNGKGSVQHLGFLQLQEWLGVSHPINTALDYVIDPLRSIPDAPTLTAALDAYDAAGAARRQAWAGAYAKYLETLHEPATPATRLAAVPATGLASFGPVPAMISALLALAQSGGLDGALLTSRQFYQTDYTKPLLFMANGSQLEERARAQHLLGTQWGMMNETGSYPGQVWLWLYTFWYQVEPFKSSHNADALVLLVMLVLSLGLICVPFIPIVRDIPRWVPVYRLIWREHYRASAPRGVGDT